MLVDELTLSYRALSQFGREHNSSMPLIRMTLIYWDANYTSLSNARPAKSK